MEQNLTKARESISSFLGELRFTNFVSRDFGHAFWRQRTRRTHPRAPMGAHFWRIQQNRAHGTPSDTLWPGQQSLQPMSRTNCRQGKRVECPWSGEWVWRNEMKRQKIKGRGKAPRRMGRWWSRRQRRTKERHRWHFVGETKLGGEPIPGKGGSRRADQGSGSAGQRQSGGWWQD